MKKSHQQILRLSSFILIAAVFAYLMVDHHHPSLKRGNMAPVEDTIFDLEKNPHAIKSLGNKGMLINFWATWCPPCRKELPMLSKLHQKYGDRIDFIGAAVDSSIDDIKQLKADFMIDFFMGLVSPQAVSNWHAHTLPTTYIIDSKGKVVWAKAGLATKTNLEAAIKLALPKHL